MTTLRPYQEAGIQKALGNPSLRQMFMWGTSAGKTLAALEFAKRLGALRILIACPAMARGTWLSEIKKWMPAWEEHVYAIRYGKDRRGLSKKKKMYLEKAYHAPITVCSYGLLDQLDQRCWDVIILDESHMLGDPLSQQSQAVRRQFWDDVTPPAALALTASAMPTDIKQVWNVINTFWPWSLGEPQPTGGISYKFLWRYCEVLQNEYGTSFKGAKSTTAIASLNKTLEPFVHKVADAEVVPYLPPLNVDKLILDEKIPIEKVARDWLLSIPVDASPIVICFRHVTGMQLAKALCTDLVTGETTPERRLERLRDKAEAHQAIVATCESIKQSIDLTCFSHVLIFEWRTSPGQASQLLGRFRRSSTKDLTRSTFVQYVVFPDDESKADLLRERAEIINQLQQRDGKLETLQELFKPQELTEESITNMFTVMLGNIRTVDTEMESEDADL